MGTVVVRGEITWLVHETGAADVKDIREALGDEYDADVIRLRDLLCSYFSADEGCVSKLGKSISPVGRTTDGGKILKVRWTTPGSGKSGGLRLCFVVYCDARTVVLCRGWVRKEADDANYDAAGKLATGYGIDEDGDDPERSG